MMYSASVLLFSSLLWKHVFTQEYDSFQALRLSLMHATNYEYASIPLQEENKYTQSGKALVVYMRTVMSDISHVGREGLEAVIHLQSSWTDQRLTFNCTCSNNNYTLAQPLRDKIWSPDTYMEPEWVPPALDTRVMKIFPSGKLITSTRVHATVPCKMEEITLTGYYMVCSSKITSYAYHADEIELRWDEELPIILLQGVIDDDSQVYEVDTSSCQFDAFNELQTSCLQINVYVRRSFSSILLRMYVPSFMTCMMAWSSFWIHRDEVSARIKLGTLVVMTVMTEYITLEISFSEYLDFPAGNVWMLGCMTFTWLSFFLYILIHVVRRREKAHDKQEALKKRLKEEEEKRLGQRSFSVTSNHPEGNVKGHLKGYSVWQGKAQPAWSPYLTSFQVDRLCRVLYGVAFFTFNVIFWTYFGIRKNRY